jgi:hypothetical protein
VSIRLISARPNLVSDILFLPIAPGILLEGGSGRRARRDPGHDEAAAQKHCQKLVWKSRIVPPSATEAAAILAAAGN